MSTTFFLAEAKNIRVGQKLLIRPRGTGLVRGIMKADMSFTCADGDSVAVENISKVCLSFEDTVLGICLTPPKGGRLGPIPGWGTFLPRARSPKGGLGWEALA